ncbi:hypothetical protein M885DRAFT_505191 [Pelagophyceae sp. CCMP2097]|nr:hypothetical protein M885DRAFT_505191 [Pelagophyceae sp. CCMP2097]
MGEYQGQSPSWRSTTSALRRLIVFDPSSRASVAELERAGWEERRPSITSVLDTPDDLNPVTFVQRRPDGPLQEVLDAKPVGVPEYVSNNDCADGELLRRVVAWCDASHAALAVTNASDGRIVHVNATWEVVHCCRSKDAVGSKPCDVVEGARTDAQCTNAFNGALKEKHGASMRVVHYRGDGQPFLAHVTSEAVFSCRHSPKATLYVHSVSDLETLSKPSRAWSIARFWPRRRSIKDERPVVRRKEPQPDFDEKALARSALALKATGASQRGKRLCGYSARSPNPGPASPTRLPAPPSESPPSRLEKPRSMTNIVGMVSTPLAALRSRHVWQRPTSPLLGTDASNESMRSLRQHQVKVFPVLEPPGRPK